jgi:hypothetical protein
MADESSLSGWYWKLSILDDARMIIPGMKDNVWTLK